MNIKHLQKATKPVFMTEAEIYEALVTMEKDVLLNTPNYRTIDSEEMVAFKEKHINYLKGHPKVNPENYLANLRTMVKIRR
jgi:hypothetical protein